MVATASARSVAVSCWPATGASGTARPRPRTATERMITRLIYLLLFVAPQVLLYLYLRERLPDPTRPQRARLVRTGLAAAFTPLTAPKHRPPAASSSPAPRPPMPLPASRCRRAASGARPVCLSPPAAP